MGFVKDLFNPKSKERRQEEITFTDPFSFNLNTGTASLTGGVRPLQTTSPQTGATPQLGTRPQAVPGGLQFTFDPTQIGAGFGERVAAQPVPSRTAPLPSRVVIPTQVTRPASNTIDVDLSGIEAPTALRDRFITGTEELLARSREPSQFAGELLTDFTGGTRDLLSRFRDNREGFIASQVDPLARRLQPIPEQTARDFARRGIAGSLPQSVVGRQREDVARQLTEARAQAEAQAVGIEAGLLENFVRARESALAERAQNLGLEGAALDRFLEASQATLAEELSKLGLSVEVANAIARTRQAASTTTQASGRSGFDLGGTLAGIGGLLTGIGEL